MAEWQIDSRCGNNQYQQWGRVGLGMSDIELVRRTGRDDRYEGCSVVNGVTGWFLIGYGRIKQGGE